MPYDYFKFYPINKNVIDSLVKGTLYFSNPRQLNDPFDCQLDLEKIYIKFASQYSNTESDEIISRLNLKEDFAAITNHFQNYGICSFSLEMINPLMWSHYADDHRGLCILYSFPKTFFTEAENNIFAVDKVSYKENPLSDFFSNTFKNPKNPPEFSDFTKELFKILLCSKSPHWSYEKETRIIKNTGGLLQIPKHFIKQICFGLQTPENDIDLIQQILRKTESKIEFCKVVRGSSDFGIKVEGL